MNLTRNLMHDGSAFQSSAQVILWDSACSHESMPLVWTCRPSCCIDLPPPPLKSCPVPVGGLKLILAQRMSRSSPWRSHLHPGTDVVITVKLSIKALMGACRVPDLDLHSPLADLTIMFMASEKSGTEMVQLVIMPFSRRCQADVTWPVETRALKSL